GLLVAEGRNNSSNQVWFVNADPAVNQDYVRLAQSLFGLTVCRKQYKACAEDVLLFSRPLGMALERLFRFPVGSRSADKEMPPQIFQASQDTQWAFLSGLFEGDAHVCVRPGGEGNRETLYIEYASASLKLARQVVALLLRFGIFALLRRQTKY